MPKVTITNLAGLDGEYPLDLPLLARDYRTIKLLSGVRANEIIDAMRAGDVEVVVAFADIALTRANVPHHVEQLWNHVPGEQIMLDFSDLEEDAGPPPSSAGPSESEPSSAPASERSGFVSNGATASSPETSTPETSGIPQPVVT